MDFRPFYIIEHTQREKLKSIAQRLFSENRLSGDEMRNMAQALESIIRNALPLNSIPEDK